MDVVCPYIRLNTSGPTYPWNLEEVPQQGLVFTNNTLNSSIIQSIQTESDMSFVFCDYAETTKHREFIIRASGKSSLGNTNIAKWLRTQDSPQDWNEMLGRVFEYDGTMHTTIHDDPTNVYIETDPLNAELTSCEGAVTLSQFQSKKIAGVCIEEIETNLRRIYNTGMIDQHYPVPQGDERINVCLKGDCLVQCTSLTEYDNGYQGQADSHIVNGDLLEVEIDGICHKQNDDIIRSMTIGKAKMDVDFTDGNSIASYQNNTYNAYTYVLLPVHLLV